MAGRARSLESMCTLKRGEAAAAPHWHDFGSLFAVVHESLEWKFGCATTGWQAGSGLQRNWWPYCIVLGEAEMARQSAPSFVGV